MSRATRSLPWNAYPTLSCEPCGRLDKFTDLPGPVIRVWASVLITYSNPERSRTETQPGPAPSSKPISSFSPTSCGEA